MRRGGHGLFGRSQPGGFRDAVRLGVVAPARRVSAAMAAPRRTADLDFNMWSQLCGFGVVVELDPPQASSGVGGGTFEYRADGGADWVDKLSCTTSAAMVSASGYGWSTGSRDNFDAKSKVHCRACKSTLGRAMHWANIARSPLQ